MLLKCRCIDHSEHEKIIESVLLMFQFLFMIAGERVIASYQDVCNCGSPSLHYHVSIGHLTVKLEWTRRPGPSILV
jgi:hypothetical protein